MVRKKEKGAEMGSEKGSKGIKKVDQHYYSVESQQMLPKIRYRVVESCGDFVSLEKDFEVSGISLEECFYYLKKVLKLKKLGEEDDKKD